MAVPDTVVVGDAPERERYEIEVDGVVAGYTMYRRRADLIAFVHTEIGSAFQGKGLADRLIAYALDDARGREEQVLPFCPFVLAFIERHPEYADLVPSDYRGRFGL